MAASYIFGPFRLDAETDALFRGGDPVSLGRRAVALLRVLVEQRGIPVSKNALMDAAWAGLTVEESNLAVQIGALRRVLGEEPGGENWIETLPGRGYRFVGPASIRDQGAVTAASEAVNFPVAVDSRGRVEDGRSQSNRTRAVACADCRYSASHRPCANSSARRNAAAATGGDSLLDSRGRAVAAARDRIRRSAVGRPDLARPYARSRRARRTGAAFYHRDCEARVPPVMELAPTTASSRSALSIAPTSPRWSASSPLAMLSARRWSRA
jgi:DNA-binding winged helix-turn-helix (wHTH) protein